MPHDPGDSAGQAPAVAFIDPDPSWNAFNGPSIRLLLTLIDQALRVGSRELMLITVQSHHASVLVLADRTPREVAQIELKFYDGIKRFLNEGLFKTQPRPRVQALGSSWELSLELVERAGGEGFTLTFKPYLFQSN